MGEGCVCVQEGGNILYGNSNKAHFIGLGINPLSNRMSKKEVWFGTYTTTSLAGGRFSLPFNLGVHKEARSDSFAHR